MKKIPCIKSVLIIKDVHKIEAIQQRIEDNDFFTVTPNVDPDKVPSLGLTILLLVDSNDIKFPTAYVAILKKQGRVATSTVRVKISFPVALEEFNIDQFIEGIPKRHHNFLAGVPFVDFISIPPKLSQIFFSRVLELFPQLQTSLLKLHDRVSNKVLSGEYSRDSDAAAEKDALGLALDIFSFPKAKVFQSWDAEDGRSGKSFLEGLHKYTVYEDDLISEDLNQFEGFKKMKGKITGVVEFENKDHDRLLVINANRKPLEKATGVDLIYYHRGYHAFTLVQYKMMDQRDANNHHYYNPNNKSHDEEFARMQKLEQKLCNLERDSTLSGYRVTECPFFFKVCRKFMLDYTDNVQTSAYIPFEQWKFFLTDPAMKGPKGGIQIGFHTMKKRYLSRSVFIDLVQRGLIGSQRESSRILEQLIEEVVTDGRSLIFAVETSAPTSEL